MADYPTDQVPGTESSGGTTAGDTVVAGLTPLAQQYLDQTRPWVRFMSIITFLTAGLMVLLGLLIMAITIYSGVAGTNREGFGLLGSAIGAGLIALLYIALACVYVVPALHLSRYASAIQRLKANATARGLEDALRHQKSFWRFIGILSVIGIVLAVVGVGLAIVAGVIAAMMAGRP